MIDDNIGRMCKITHRNGGIFVGVIVGEGIVNWTIWWFRHHSPNGGEMTPTTSTYSKKCVTNGSEGFKFELIT